MVSGPANSSAAGGERRGHLHVLVGRGGLEAAGPGAVDLHPGPAAGPGFPLQAPSVYTTGLPPSSGPTAKSGVGSHVGNLEAARPIPHHPAPVASDPQ